MNRFLIILIQLMLLFLTVSCFKGTNGKNDKNMSQNIEIKQTERTAKSESNKRDTLRNNHDDIIDYASYNKHLDSVLRVNSEHDKSSMYELPRLVTKKPEQISYRFAYSLSFNKDTRCPNWVAWPLEKGKTNGEFSRNRLKPNYYQDIDDLTNHQNLDDWHDAYPYQHGHMCPAADGRWNEAAIQQTFFLSNMCPQIGDLNEGDWENLEDKCRGWAEEFGQIYICAGPIFYSKSYKTLANSSIAIPDAFYKVILRLKPQPAAIGFILPNDDVHRRFFETAKTIDEVEKITGIDFFYIIDDNIEKSVESKYELKTWHIREK